MKKYEKIGELKNNGAYSLSFFLNRFIWLSLPDNNRLIFLWCVKTTKMAVANANKRYMISGSRKIKNIKTGNAMLAVIELSETYRVKNSIKKKTMTKLPATIG